MITDNTKTSVSNDIMAIGKINQSLSLHMLQKHSVNFAHDGVVPEPIVFHQVHADIVMTTARDDGCRNDTGATPPQRITEAC